MSEWKKNYTHCSTPEYIILPKFQLYDKIYSSPHLQDPCSKLENILILYSIDKTIGLGLSYEVNFIFSDQTIDCCLLARLTDFYRSTFSILNIYLFVLWQIGLTLRGQFLWEKKTTQIYMCGTVLVYVIMSMWLVTAARIVLDFGIFALMVFKIE